MNRTYRLVWNDACRAWIAVGENAKAHGKRSGKASRPPMGRSLGAIAVAGALLALPFVAHAKSAADVGANALPTGFVELRGNGNTAQVTGNVLDVTQNGQRAVFGWNSFDVGTAATVNFKQQAGGIALNIIGGTDPSFVLGKLNANSTVFFVNPSGMFFGNGASVNVGGMLATTMSMDPDAFMSGNYRLTNPGSGIIRNEGIIKASGSVALVGNTVQNAGNIFATTVTLAAGNAVAVDLTGDGLIRARVEDPALKASISNSGNITATLAVTLTAGQARDTLDRVVNNSGVIRATGLAARGGDIVLEGGLITNSGTLDASSTTGAGGSINVLGRNVLLASNSILDVSGASSGGTAKVLGDMSAGHVDVDGRIYARGGSGDGGFIETSADEVRIADSFRINALSDHGHAGKWLIDPIDFTILLGNGALTSSGIGASTLSNALEGADVTISTDNVNSAAGNYGDIYVYSPVSWSASTTLTLNAYGHIYMNAGITALGNGSVKLRADSTGTGTGNVFFGGGGHVTTNGTGRTDIYYNPTGGYAGANRSDTGNDPYSSYVTGLHTAWMLTNTTANVQGMNTNLAGFYALGKDVDFTGFSGFAPIGGTTGPSSPFTGKFDGLGHIIDHLSISCTYGFGPCYHPGAGNSNSYVGLFGLTSNTAVIQNVGLTNAVIDTDSSGYSAQYVGLLVGSNGGSIVNSYVTGTIGSSSHTPKGSFVGGLAGQNTGSVTGSHANVVVFGSNFTGGLIGQNGGTISNSYALGTVHGASWMAGGLVGSNSSPGTIQDSYATGDVIGASYSDGGLVGDNYGTILRSYATGNVSGTLMVGGLVGSNQSGSHVTDSYAIGTVDSTGTFVGGLVGDNSGAIAGSHATGKVTSTYSGTDGNGRVDYNDVGGLAGANEYGATISDSYATGDVSATHSKNVGGLVGNNYGGITRSFATGHVSGTYDVGGLVGYNNSNSATHFGQISDSYATGDVYGSGTLSGSGADGGLVGYNEGAISNSYATGKASNYTGANLGGLVGYNQRYDYGSGSFSPASIHNSFWNTQTSCATPPCNTGIGGWAVTADLAGVVNASGLSPAAMMTESNFSSAGWNISTHPDASPTWLISEGHTNPLLRNLLSAQIPSSGSGGSGLGGGSSSSGSGSSSSGDGSSSSGSGSGRGNSIIDASGTAAAGVAGASDSHSGTGGQSGFSGVLADSGAMGGAGTTSPSGKDDGSPVRTDKPKGRMLVCHRGA